MKSFPDNNDSVFFDWGKIWGKINVHSRFNNGDIDLYTLKYIFLARKFVSIIFQRLSPSITPLEIAQRHKFASRKSCIYKLAP